VAGLEIPPIIDEMVIAIGGPVEIAAYAFPGTQELADSVCAALGDRNAALIRNHGSVGVGRDLREAVDVSALLEHAAKVLVYATLAGKVNTLPPEAIEVEKSMYQMRGGRMEGPA
jgi:L-fuculose-phosphate aldolase